jgi:flagellar biosynthesis/type III secretory pathway M-ring protein FliF/YscJ
MKMEERKPRPTRFGTESNEARLARLREQAPTLGTNRKLRLYAIFGSVLLFLTVAAFYMAMQIYKAVSGQREEDALIEVDQAPVIEQSETEKALQRAEAEEAQREAELEQQLEELREVDIFQTPGV